PEYVGLEVPAVDAAAQIVGDPPDRLVQLRPLRLLAYRGHGGSLSRRADVSNVRRQGEVNLEEFGRKNTATACAPQHVLAFVELERGLLADRFERGLAHSTRPALSLGERGERGDSVALE